MKYKFLLTICAALFFVIGMHTASAATLNLTTGKTSFAIGDQFTVDVKIDSEGTGINAAQATIQVPKNVLEIVKTDKTDSVFNFWLVNPAISSDGSELSFVGGSTSGFSGKSLQILRLTIKVKGSGDAFLMFTDGVVTANDGSGTNVLSALKGLTIVSVPTAGMEPAISEQPRPAQITRPAAPATGLPARPQLQVPLYPDPQRWYNVSAPFSAQWALPADITEVATLVDKNPAGIPPKTEGLFDNKQYAALEDGIWYLHVQFRNSIGWGSVAHYRIAIDTMPPAAFTARFEQGTSTDNPTPTIHFRSGDPAGIAQYYLRIDDGDRITVQPDTHILPLQEPGTHIVRIGAEDNAGNITENRLTLQITPITSPIITSVNGNVYLGEENFQLSGATTAGTTVRILLKGAGGQVLADIAASPDDNGNWSVSLVKGLPIGKYYFEIRAVDARGALSYPVKSEMFSVSIKPFLIIGGLQSSLGAFFGMIIVLLLLIAGTVWLLRRAERRQQARKIIMCQRDITNMIALVKKDVDKILEKYSDDKIDETEITEIQHLAKKVSENIEKSKKYCVQSIGEIND